MGSSRFCVNLLVSKNKVQNDKTHDVHFWPLCSREISIHPHRCVHMPHTAITTKVILWIWKSAMLSSSHSCLDLFTFQLIQTLWPRWSRPMSSNCVSCQSGTVVLSAPRDSHKLLDGTDTEQCRSYLKPHWRVTGFLTNSQGSDGLCW